MSDYIIKLETLHTAQRLIGVACKAWEERWDYKAERNVAAARMVLRLAFKGTSPIVFLVSFTLGAIKAGEESGKRRSGTYALKELAEALDEVVIAKSADAGGKNEL